MAIYLINFSQLFLILNIVITFFADKIISKRQNKNPIMSQVAPPAGKPVEQEFSVRLPRSRHKNLSAMRFNGNLNVDFTKWANVKLQREDNSAEYKGADDDMPKFGAGSEFGAEARRRKYAGSSKKYNIENQPWILKVNNILLDIVFKHFNT